jgi:large subunit ribosomal protein L31
MKESIHPVYRDVVFKDLQSGFEFRTRSTIQTKETIQWTDGKEYPLAKVEISSKSHPFYTGQKTFVDTLGRVERFQKKFAGEYFKKDAKGAKPAASDKK